MEKVKKIYEDISYLDEYFGSILIAAVLTIVLVFILTYVYILLHLKSLKDNWLTVRCHPLVVPFAGIINKPTTSTALEFTEENFVLCSQNIFKNLIQVFLKPLNILIEGIRQLFEDLMSVIQMIRIAIANLRKDASSTINEILSAVEMVIVVMQEFALVFKDSFQKTVGILTSGIYIFLSLFDTFKSSMLIFMNSTIAGLIIFAAIITMLFFDFFTMPIAIAGLVVYLTLSKPFEIIMQFMEDVLQIKPSLKLPKDPKKPLNMHLCFTPDSMNNGKRLDEYTINDSFANNCYITAKYTLAVSNETKYYQYNDIIVTEMHKVFFKEKNYFVPVKEHPDFVQVFPKCEYLVCFNTNSGIIPLNGQIFYDWKENDCSPQEEHLSKDIELFNDIKLHDLKLNDFIDKKTRVIGIIEFQNQKRNIITNTGFIPLKNKKRIKDGY